MTVLTCTVKIGSKDDTTTNQTNPSGVGSAHFQDRQADQKMGTPGALDGAYQKAHYGEGAAKGK